MRQGTKKAVNKYGEDLAVCIDKVNMILQSNGTYSKQYKIARRIRGWLQKEFKNGKTVLSGDWRADPRLCVNYIAERIKDDDFALVKLQRIDASKPFSPTNTVVITPTHATIT